MPASFIKGPDAEKAWERAKKIVQKGYPDLRGFDKLKKPSKAKKEKFYALATSVYKNICKSDKYNCSPKAEDVGIVDVLEVLPVMLEAEEEYIAEISNVARTILKQIGGTSRLHAMIGAYNFVADDNALVFRFKAKGMGRKGRVNMIRIVYKPGSDLYNVIAYYVRGSSIKLVDSIKGVYFDQLFDAMEELTGLSFSL